MTAQLLQQLVNNNNNNNNTNNNSNRNNTSQTIESVDRTDIPNCKKIHPEPVPTSDMGENFYSHGACETSATYMGDITIRVGQTLVQATEEAQLNHANITWMLYR